MKGKVKCTCGWSWNKSDSSKKDMYICHECGRDNSNNMQNGGWLDSYADGGTMQEHQENYNDSQTSAPEGFQGEGYSNVGRNYSPAWGGQFQSGGLLKNLPKVESFYKKPTNSKKETKSVVKDKTSTKPVINERLAVKELDEINNNQQKIKDAKAYYKKYLNSPKAKERISNMIDYKSDPEYDRLFPEEKNSAVDQEIKNRLAGLNKLTGKFDYINDVGTDSSSYYAPATNVLHVRPNSDANISHANGDENQWNNRIDLPNTIGHELGHGIQRASNKNSNNIWYRNGLSKKESDLLMRANIGLMSFKNRDEILNDKDNPEYKYELDHDNKPSELKADIDALRYQLYREGIYDAGTQDFTREHLEKAKPSFTKSRLKEHFTDDELIDLMNKLSYNQNEDDGITPIAQMGGNIYPVNYVPQAQDGEIVGDAGQELIDYLQRYSRYTKGMPGIGSAIGVTQSLANGEDMKVSDQLGLFPHPYMQAASLTALYAEKEKQNLEDYAKRQLEHNSLSELLEEKTNKQLVNNKKVDNTYVPKPKVEKIKPKLKPIPYVERKDINPVVIDNTAVGRSRKEFQNGGLTFLQPTSDKLPEGYRIPYSDPSSERAMSIGGENGEPAYLIPSFKYGKELYTPIEEFKRTGEHLGGPFKTWQEAEEWENTVRHPAVENRETIMFPQEKFQTGGSMPGAVGFSYARIGAPSKGPHRNQTDVTDASAQNGLEMRYYQNGLDWKPKSIGQEGLQLPSVRSLINDTMNRKIQSKGKGKEVNIVKIDNTKTVTPKIGKIATAKEKEQRAIEQNKLAQQQSEQQAAKDWVQGSMEEAYKSPLMSPGYFTPEGAIIGAMQGAVKMGPDLYEGNYLDATGDAISMLPFAAEFGPEIKAGLSRIKTSISPELRQGLQTNGFSDMFKSKPKFNSEIDWGKWNKEIPDNKDLMQEYKTIEQTSKANGSWMKNPDGSVFQGTPEQFVQQNSENFKKAFPKGSNISYRGDLSEISELKSQQELGKEAIKNKYNLTDKDTEALEKLWSRSKDKLNSGKYTTNDYEAALKYAKGDENKVLSLYTDIRNPKFTDTGESFRVLEKDRQKLLSEGYDALITKPSSFYPEGENVLLKTNQLKSATGNNGMFDMTNPNIYKAIVPGAIGLGAASQLNNEEEVPGFKQGGIIKDNMGYWNPENWGKPVEIGSNDITMEGVYEPLLGVSDTGDTKLMKPGKNYKFKGKKVTEYPIAKNGKRQEQKGLVNLDNLTNFTNYNTKQPGGWLDQY